MDGVFVGYVIGLHEILEGWNDDVGDADLADTGKFLCKEG
jgi:hypothetical protein